MDFKKTEKLFLNGEPISIEELEGQGLTVEKIEKVIKDVGGEPTNYSFAALVRQARLGLTSEEAELFGVGLINSLISH